MYNMAVGTCYQQTFGACLHHKAIKIKNKNKIARPLLVCYTLDCRLRVIKLRVRVSNEGDVAFERYCRQRSVIHGAVAVEGGRLSFVC